MNMTIQTCTDNHNVYPQNSRSGFISVLGIPGDGSYPNLDDYKCEININVDAIQSFYLDSGVKKKLIAIHLRDSYYNIVVCDPMDNPGLMDYLRGLIVCNFRKIKTPDIETYPYDDDINKWPLDNIDFKSYERNFDEALNGTLYDNDFVTDKNVGFLVS